MTHLDDLKSSFERKLDERAAQHKERLDDDLAALRETLLRQATTALPADIAQRLQEADERLSAPSSRQSAAYSEQSRRAPDHFPTELLLNLSGSALLRELDAAFIKEFNLERYYPLERLTYPIVYCESLEEFFTPWVEGLNLSPQARQQMLEHMVARAEKTAAERGGGGILGYNLPGVGCYLNGWLFVYGRGIPPRAALEHPALLPTVLGTAAHEKLGHGFLSAYSALGQVKSDLGITLLEIANRFGLRPADDPVDELRTEQKNELFMASQLVEEGWSTWVETYLAAKLKETGRHPFHSLKAIAKAVETLPFSIPNREERQATLLGSLAVLFGSEVVSLPTLHQAVRLIESVLGSELDDYFGKTLGQPLRYAVGELLMAQAEANLGTLCVPYAALIAANIRFDPQELSLGDLREMFATKAHLYPDARLAALSRLKLEEPNDIAELARRAEAVLSFSVPSELKSNS